MEFKHKSVLFQESIDALGLKDGMIAADGTAGGGGHSRAIAQRIGSGHLYAIDRDPDAVQVLRERLGDLPNVTVVHDRFSNIAEILKEHGETELNAFLLDLGVSSFQLDNAGRGFSFHSDEPLDMRMSKTGLSAYDVVNTYDQDRLADILFRYGEERYAKSIARGIVQARSEKPIETTFELVDIVRRHMPARALRGAHPARRTFQAIRIEVNGELQELSCALDSAFACLSSGGRIAVITFHSLEDRIVKEKFAEWTRGCTCPKDFPVCVCGNKPKGKLVFKSKTPSEDELAENPRAHSARLRAFEKF